MAEQTNQIDWSKPPELTQGQAATSSYERAGGVTAGQAAQGRTTNAQSYTSNAERAGMEKSQYERSAAATSAAERGAATDVNVDQNQTVQGQIRGIIDENSPLMQQAATASRQQMAQRGIVNSSMAVQAGQGAVYQAAMPIATADANTFATAARQNAAQRTNMSQFNAQNQTQNAQFNAGQLQQNNQFNAQTATQSSQFNAGEANLQNRFNAQNQTQNAQFNAGQQQQGSQFNAQSANAMSQFNTGETNLQNRYNAGQLQQNNQFNAQMATQNSQFNTQARNDMTQFNISTEAALLKQSMDADTRVSLANIEANYQTLMQSTQAAGSLYSQMLTNISNIQNNQNMDAASKNAAIEAQYAYLENGMNLVAGMNNIDISDLLQFEAPPPEMPNAPPPAPRAPPPRTELPNYPYNNGEDVYYPPDYGQYGS